MVCSCVVRVLGCLCACDRTEPNRTEPNLVRGGLCSTPSLFFFRPYWLPHVLMLVCNYASCVRVCGYGGGCVCSLPFMTVVV